MIVVTGANGRLGRLVAGRLADAGHASEVRLTTRDPKKVKDLTELGFRTIAADFADPESLDAAFENANVILLISATGPVEARIPLHRNAIAAAGAPIQTESSTPHVSTPLQRVYMPMLPFTH